VYELSVNSQQVSLTVEESDTNAADTESEVESQADTETDQTTGESTTESEDDTPGFGVVSAVVGLLVAVAVFSGIATRDLKTCPSDVASLQLAATYCCFTAVSS